MRFILTIFIFLLTSHPSGAKSKQNEKISPVIDFAHRSIDTEWTVKIDGPPEGLTVAIDVGRVAADMSSGGILDSLIVAARDKKATVLRNNQKERSDAYLAPVRTAITDFDIDALAVAKTEAALRKIPWFRSSVSGLSHDGLSASDAVPVKQRPKTPTLNVTYVTEFSPNFEHFRLIGTFDFSLPKCPPNNNQSGSVVCQYRQTILAVVQLKNQSYEPAENSESWAAESGKRARTALTAAFDIMENLIPRSIELTKTDLDRYSDKNADKAFGAGYYGSLVARDPARSSGLTIWSGGYIGMQTLAE